MIGIILLALTIILWVLYFILDNYTYLEVVWMLIPAGLVSLATFAYGCCWLEHISEVNPDFWNWLLFLE